jgi:ubiquinone biosynthesis protein COQ4
MKLAFAPSEFEIPELDRATIHALKPLRHPDRQPLYHDFVRAWRHFQQFKRDKEQTSVAFCVFDSLPWRDIDKAAEAFLATERGRAIYANEPCLPEILDDHVTLRRLPRGSLAHDYCDFMEQEGLSAAGLVAATEQMFDGRPRLDDRIEWYVDRQRDIHDLVHVLTGYGRDALGEQCVAAFIFTQRPSWGHFFIAYTGAVVTKYRIRSRAPVLSAVIEAHRNGRKCPRIAEMPVRELLALPTETVRQRCRIVPPQLYAKVHSVWREAGHAPF